MLSNCSRAYVDPDHPGSLIYLDVDMWFFLVPALIVLAMPPVMGLFSHGYTPAPGEHKAIVCVTLFMFVQTTVFAIPFSIVWDALIVEAGVWTFDPQCVHRIIGSLPLEEVLLYPLMIILGQAITVRAWGCLPHVPPTPIVPSRFKDPRIMVPCLLGVGLGGVGVYLMGHDYSTYYLGVIFAFMAPLVAMLWFITGQVILIKANTLVIGIMITFIYTLLVDTYSIRMGVWAIYEGMGIYLPVPYFDGIQLEECVIYLALSIIVVVVLQPWLIMANKYARRQDRSLWFPRFAVVFLWTSGAYPAVNEDATSSSAGVMLPRHASGRDPRPHMTPTGMRSGKRRGPGGDHLAVDDSEDSNVKQWQRRCDQVRVGGGDTEGAGVQLLSLGDQNLNSKGSPSGDAAIMV